MIKTPLKCPKCSQEMYIDDQKYSIVSSNNFYGHIDDDSYLPDKLTIRVERTLICDGDDCSSLDKYTYFHSNIYFKSVEGYEAKEIREKEA